MIGIGSDVFPGPNLMCFTLRRGVLHLNLPFLHTFLNIDTCKNFSEKKGGMAILELLMHV